MEIATPEDAAIRVRHLVALAVGGDHHAYAELVERYKHSLFRLAIRILRRTDDAEDAVQEAFIKAYVHLESYRDSYAFYTWISAILTNICYSTLRARDWQVAPMSNQLVEAVRAVDPLDDPETAALVQSRDEVLRRAIAGLPEKYGRILVLRYLSELSYQEVADVTGQSLGAVKTQVRRATILLRETLLNAPVDLLPDGV